MESAAPERVVALVAGVTGIVGLSLAELLLGRRPAWRLYGVARRPKPTWFQHHAATTYIQCDLLDREQTLANLAPLSHLITHLFFTTWTCRHSEEDNVKANTDMLRNTLDALMQPNSALLHVCLQTSTQHYLGSIHDLLSCVPDSSSTVPIFVEDTPRLPGLNFYYAQEDLLIQAARTRESSACPLTWAVHRPTIILGVSPAALIQVPFFLAAYACICKHDEDGLPFSFTGTPQVWDCPVEAADSRLIAEQEIWAATHPVAHNQAFNVSNGDRSTWRDIWPVIASFFELQAPPYKGESQSLVQILEGKAHVWERVVAQYKLLPTTWEQLVTGWWAIDFTIRHIPAYQVSTVKSAKLGFAGSAIPSTEASLLANFRTMQTMGLIPQQGT